MEKQARIDEAKDVEKKNEDKLTQKAQKDPPADVVQTVPYDVDAALYEHYMQNPESQWRMEEADKTQDEDETTEEADEKKKLLRAETLKLGEEEVVAAKAKEECKEARCGSNESGEEMEKKTLEDSGSQDGSREEKKRKGGVLPGPKQETEKKTPKETSSGSKEGFGGEEKGNGGVLPRPGQEMEKKKARGAVVENDEVHTHGDTGGIPKKRQNGTEKAAPTEDVLDPEKKNALRLDLVDLDSDDEELRDSAVPLSLLVDMQTKGLSLQDAIASLRNAIAKAPIVKRIEQYKIKKVKVAKAGEERRGSCVR